MSAQTPGGGTDEAACLAALEAALRERDRREVEPFVDVFAAHAAASTTARKLQAANAALTRCGAACETRRLRCLQRLLHQTDSGFVLRGINPLGDTAATSRRHVRSHRRVLPPLMRALPASHASVSTDTSLVLPPATLCCTSSVRNAGSTRHGSCRAASES